MVVVARTALQDRIANLNGQTVHYILSQDLPRFKRLMGVSVFQSLLSALMAQSLKYLSDSLALSWRKQITLQLSHQYFEGNNLYLASRLGGMGDADQRITRDVDRLCDDVASLIPNMVKPVVDIVWFTSRLWALTGARGMGIAYLYILVGYGALKAVTPDFGALAAEAAGMEGVFRSVHHRLRSHAESVAFFGGGAREGGAIEEHFARFLRHLRRTALIRWAHGAADEFFSRQLPHNITWVLTLLYALDFPGDRASDQVQGAMVHNMRYLASIVTNTFVSFGDILSLHKRFVELAGGVSRVVQLRDALSSAALAGRAMKRNSTQHLVRDAGDDVALRGVHVVTPQGATLARKLSVAVRKGQGLLITGPNGAGKTAIVRVLAGLWPIVSGHVSRPNVAKGLRSELFFVPQKPYTTPGTFRDQVGPPPRPAPFTRRGSDGPWPREPPPSPPCPAPRAGDLPPDVRGGLRRRGARPGPAHGQGVPGRGPAGSPGGGAARVPGGAPRLGRRGRVGGRAVPGGAAAGGHGAALLPLAPVRGARRVHQRHVRGRRGAPLRGRRGAGHHARHHLPAHGPRPLPRAGAAADGREGRLGAPEARAWLTAPRASRVRTASARGRSSRPGPRLTGAGGVLPGPASLAGACDAASRLKRSPPTLSRFAPRATPPRRQKVPGGLQQAARGTEGGPLPTNSS